METIDIALASDHNYFCGLLVTAVSMARHASRNVRLRFDILDGGLTDEDWMILRQKIEVEHPNTDLRKFPIDESRFSAFPSWNSGSRMIYARLEIAALIHDAEFVLHCDVDFLWTADVAELWALREPRFVLQGHPDGWESTLAREAAWFARQNAPFDFSRYICAGLMLINLPAYRQKNVAGEVISFLERHPDAPYAEQTALNALVRDIGLLPRKWHRFSRDMKRDELKGAWAIHFAGDLPWICHWRAQPLNDAVVLWHRFHGRLMGVGAWESLRCFFSAREIIFRRTLFGIVNSRLLRKPFFAFLRLIGHDGCVPYYQEQRR